MLLYFDRKLVARWSGVRQELSEFSEWNLLNLVQISVYFYFFSKNSKTFFSNFQVGQQVV